MKQLKKQSWGKNQSRNLRLIGMKKKNQVRQQLTKNKEEILQKYPNDEEKAQLLAFQNLPNKLLRLITIRFDPIIWHPETYRECMFYINDTWEQFGEYLVKEMHLPCNWELCTQYKDCESLSQITSFGFSTDLAIKPKSKRLTGNIFNSTHDGETIYVSYVKRQNGFRAAVLGWNVEDLIHQK